MFVTFFLCLLIFGGGGAGVKESGLGGTTGFFILDDKIDY